MIPPPRHLRVLGAPVLLGPDGPMTGRAAYRRRIALLAILAVARRRPVGRERVIGLLWPEHSADAARHTLSESLYVLRKELGDEAFLAVGDELALAPEAVGTDVDAFEGALEEGRLEEAVAAYGGPFLDGFYVSDAPEFERWVDGERDRLARAYAQALEKLAVRAEEEARPLAAAEWWRRLAAHDPYSARVAARLAESLDAGGERAAALRALAGHAARIRADLEVEPEAAVRALEERLRTVPAPAPAPPPAAAPSPSAVPPDASAADAGPDAAAVDGVAGASPSRPAAAPPAPAPRRGASWRARWGPAAATAALLLVLAAAALVPSLARRSAAGPPAERYDPRRVAVLYFEDQSPRGDLGYLAAGLAGELIDQLGDVAALDVVSRNAVKAYHDGQVSYDSLVARLRVGSVVSGTVQRAGDSVRVTVQLVDTNREKQLERQVVIRPAGDLFALERSVGEEVSGFLRRRLGQEVRFRQAAAETRSAEALALTFRGEAAREEAARMAARGHPLDRASALRLYVAADSFLAAAEAADPGWGRPSVQRGLVSLARALLVTGRAREALEAAAGASAARALARDPRDAQALTLRGRVEWRQSLGARDSAAEGALLAAAERDLRAAVAADSSLASAWAVLSQLLRVRGRLAEADLAARHALEADAYLEDADAVLSRLYYSAMTQGDFAQARRWCETGHAQFPGRWSFVECQLTLAREDPSVPPSPARAWALAAELDRLDPPARAAEEGWASSAVYRLASVAAVLARAGERDSARAVLARARRAAAASAPVRDSFVYDDAYVTLLLGDSAGARRLLDSYLAAHPELRSYVTRDAAFRTLLTR